MRKILTYGLWLILILTVIFLSVKIRKTDKTDTPGTSATFAADEFALKFWENDLPGCISNAIDADQLINLLGSDPQSAFAKYSRKLGISHTFYFMVSDTGKIVSVEKEYIEVETSGNHRIQIATSFIYGNAVRDGSGKVDIDRFLNMTEFNNVSIGINKLVKERVAAPLLKDASKGMSVHFAGATEINSEEPIPLVIRIIPVSASLSDGKAGS